MNSGAFEISRARHRSGTRTQGRLLCVREHCHEPQVIADRLTLAGDVGGRELPQALRPLSEYGRAIGQSRARGIVLAEGLNLCRIEDAMHR
jgi:hypothetical protein